MTLVPRGRGRFVPRAAAIGILALGLGGPTPGYVGTCDPSSGGSSTVSPAEFCTTSRTYFCARDRAAVRLSEASYNTCIHNVPTACNGWNFPNGCSPSSQIAQACYDALRRLDMLSTPNDRVTQCQSAALCGGAMLEGI